VSIAEGIALACGIAYLAGGIWFVTQIIRSTGPDDEPKGCLTLLYFPFLPIAAMAAGIVEMLAAIIKGLFILAVRVAPKSWIRVRFAWRVASVRRPPSSETTYCTHSCFHSSDRHGDRIARHWKQHLQRRPICADQSGSICGVSWAHRLNK
jgi:hypothetical protein